VNDGPIGQIIRTDSMKATTVKGVFACGDATVRAEGVPVTVGDGYFAGASTHRSLVFE
jgi:thioredoxin reductase